MNLPAGGDWPDWRNLTAVVVASGPSAKDAPLAGVKGRAIVLVVKDNLELAPWADALYAADFQWWEQHRGVPEFKGIKLSAAPHAVRMFPDIRQIRLVALAKILLNKKGTVGCGSRLGNGHSGFHALNLAVQFGAKRIVLVGFDMTLEHGLHWHDRPAIIDPTPKLMAEWCEALDGCAGQFAALGISVVNASRVSALKNYPKRDLMQAIAG